jgi:hypothetical protein
MDWIYPAQNMERCQAVVDMEVNFWGSNKGRAFFEQMSDCQFLK